mmetsp:Transcript_30020/g.29270  ORF Transcript_30020/g.29270 Transcript_30020/m.29270 type:complete len:83 (+) Transcript_30020:373-621(+)
MKPLIYSMKDAESRNVGWTRVGDDISYYQNPNAKAKLGSGLSNGAIGGVPSNYYTLSFKLQFKHDHDEVYFAYCYPYTYSDC